MSLIMRYVGGLTDEGIVGRDQLIACISNEIPCQLVTNDTGRYNESAETKANKTVVNPQSPVITINARGAPMMGHGKNVALIIDDSKDIRERAAHYDEVWGITGLPPSFRVDHLVRPETMIEPGDAANTLPTDEDIALMHEGVIDLIGMRAALRGWCLAGWTRDLPLVVSLHGVDARFTKHLVSNVMEEFGRRDIFVLRDPSTSMLDACIARSRVIVCAHITERGWRPIAMKAALAGRHIITPRLGGISSHLVGCRWVDLPTKGMDPKHVTDAFASALDRSIIGETIPVIGASNVPTLASLISERSVELIEEARN